MAWLCKDKVEKIFKDKPSVEHNRWVGQTLFSDKIVLPEGTIKKIIGRDLTFLDEPVEIKED